MQFGRTSNSPDETALIGRALGRVLSSPGPLGSVVLVDGALGAGKTTLTRAVAEGMGVDTRAVSSPTFVMVHEYAAGADGPALIHVDAYRLHDGSELESLGWDRVMEQVERGEAALLVEWAERLGAEFMMDRERAHVRIEHIGEEQREFSFTLPDAWAGRTGIGELTGRRATRCPISGEAVPPESPTYPFASIRAKQADLYRWFSGSYQISRPIEERDLEEGVD